MRADLSILHMTFSKVIEEFYKFEKFTLREAMDIFYKSRVYQEMRLGISDMHCRSDKYLAEELMLELNNKSQR